MSATTTTGGPGTTRSTATMTALQLVGWHSPPQLREVPRPVPGPGQVLLRVGAAGACHSDLHLLDEFDETTLPLTPPWTLGHENAGWVEELGAGVTGLEVGEAVAVHGPWGCGRCRACRLSCENYCEHAAEIGVMGGGLGLDGGMAEFLLVPTARPLLPLGGLDPRDAAPLSDAALTPYHAIKRSLHKLHPGSSVVVIGAGGLGHMGIQILRAICDTTVIAVDRSADKLALAREVGADVAVPAGPDAAAEVLEATRGRGAELVLDIVGGDDTLALAMAVGRPEGDVALVGLGSGTFAYGFFTQPFELSISTTYWGSAVELQEVLELARRGHIASHIERHPLSEAAAVYDRLRRGEVRGRAVVCPNGV
jgi:propanol-preferring alcohol dehydrogenase